MTTDDYILQINRYLYRKYETLIGQEMEARRKFGSQSQKFLDLREQVFDVKRLNSEICSIANRNFFGENKDAWPPRPKINREMK